MKMWCAVLCLFLLSAVVACGNTVPPTRVTVTEIPATALPAATLSQETVPAPTNLPVTQTTAPTVTPAATETAAPQATLPPPTESNAVQTATETPAPPTLSATKTPLPTFTMTATAAPHGNVANGATVFAKVGCKGCHMPPPNSKRIAPDLTHILADADEFTHRADYKGTATDAPSYIRESIVLPNIFVVPAFRYLTRDGSSIMPLDFAQRLSAAEIDDLVAYVLTLP